MRSAGPRASSSSSSRAKRTRAAARDWRIATIRRRTTCVARATAAQRSVTLDDGETRDGLRRTADRGDGCATSAARRACADRLESTTATPLRSRTLKPRSGWSIAAVSPITLNRSPISPGNVSSIAWRASCTRAVSSCARRCGARNCSMPLPIRKCACVAKPATRRPAATRRFRDCGEIHPRADVLHADVDQRIVVEAMPEVTQQRALAAARCGSTGAAAGRSR